MKPVHLSFDKRVVVAVSIATALSGCGLFQSSDPEYKGLQRGAALEIPPDLSQLQKDDRYTVPGNGRGATTASQLAAGAGQSGAAQPGQTVLPTVKVARIERAGNQRWLVVEQTPEQVFNAAREFWSKNDFKIATEDREAGVLETEWTQDKARMPKTGLRAFFGRFGESLFDTGERDRYRTRIERAGNVTEVYISHRGAEEIMTASKDQTVWQPRASDPNLEAQYLQKFLVYLGGDELKAAAAPGTNAAGADANAAPVVVVERAKLVKAAGGSHIDVDDGFERAWRRVGLALDRTGFTVEERDKAGGRYVVRYVDPDQDKEGPGFFARLFGNAQDIKPVQYRVFVRTQGSVVQVTVQPVAAPTDKTPDASERILQLLHDELK